jgi:hypothetical protein
MRKLQPPKIEGVKNLKNKPSNAAKVGSWTPKISFYVFLLLSKFKMICKTSSDAPVAL